MSPRTLLEIALRILGIWYIVSMLHTITASLTILVGGGWGQPGVDLLGWFLLSGLSVMLYFLTGAALVTFAPAIASWFYPQLPSTEDVPARVGPGDVYHTGCFLLGVYLMVCAAVPAGRIVNAALRGRAFTMAGDTLTLIVYLASGVLLVFGAQRVSNFLTNLRYDPDTVPQQRITLAVLLVVMLLFALLLGAVRWASTGSV